MYEIICDYCGKRYKFQELSQKPDSCEKCNTFLDHIEVKEINISLSVLESDEFQHQLKLIYLQTSEEICITNMDRILLGRESIGKEVLQKIQISREHCVIELLDGNYFITDYDSKNGTYLGNSKIDCKKNPKQRINNNDIIYLGKEALLVKITEAKRDIVEQNSKQENTKSEKKLEYRCSNCGHISSENRSEICPKCGSFDSFVET